MSSTFKKRAEEIRRKIRNRAATLAVGAVVATSFAPSQAHAQTRDDNSKVNTEVTFNASTGKFERVASSQTQNQQSGRTITLQEAQTMTQSGRGSATSAQGIEKSLPAYTQALIRERGYEILPEFQGGKTTGLNRPAAGVMYACVVQDPFDANRVLFLPVAETAYEAGSRNPRTIKIVACSYDDAINYMRLNRGPYEANPRYAVNTENMLRDKQTELSQREQMVYQGNKEAELDAKEKLAGVRHTRQKVQEGVREVRRGVQTMQEGVDTYKALKRSVEHIFGGR